MGRRVATVLFLSVLTCLAGRAEAQGVGIGPRFSFVRGDIVSTTPAVSFVGGTMRLKASPKVGIELSMDYRSQRSTDLTQRVREIPFQGSLLLYLSRSRFRPYLLGGYGMYTQLTDVMSGTGETLSTTRDRKTGIHLGMGAEVFVSHHAALFADYRFRFVKFGPSSSDDQPINIPGSSLIPGLDQVKLSHHGSMWTSGMAFYF